MVKSGAYPLSMCKHCAIRQDYIHPLNWVAGRLQTPDLQIKKWGPGRLDQEITKVCLKFRKLKSLVFQGPALQQDQGHPSRRVPPPPELGHPPPQQQPDRKTQKWGLCRTHQPQELVRAQSEPKIVVCSWLKPEENKQLYLEKLALIYRFFIG